MARALIAGHDSDEIDVLAEAAHRLLGPEFEFLAVEVSSASVDVDLAWGTDVPVVRSLSPPEGAVAPFELFGNGPGPTSEASVARTELPLGEDGDSATAVLEAARKFDVDVIVAAVRDRGWLSRFLFGSVTIDLIRATSIPILVLSPEQHRAA